MELQKNNFKRIIIKNSNESIKEEMNNVDYKYEESKEEQPEPEQEEQKKHKKEEQPEPEQEPQDKIITLESFIFLNPNFLIIG